MLRNTSSCLHLGVETFSREQDRIHWEHIGLAFLVLRPPLRVLGGICAFYESLYHICLICGAIYDE
jgi:uncharacterized membrane protein